MTIPNAQLQSLALNKIRHLIRETADQEQALAVRLTQGKETAEKEKASSLALCEQSTVSTQDEALQQLC